MRGKRNRHRPLWWGWIVVTVAVAIIGVAVAAWQLIDPLATNNTGDRASAVQATFSAMVGVGGLATLGLFARRQWLQERIHHDAKHDAEQRRITEQYVQAVEQLGHEKAPVRLGGLYALDRLGRSYPEQRQVIAEVWCAYLRRQYAPPDVIFGEQDADAPDDNVMAEAVDEYEVRMTAQRLLADHLKDPRLSGERDETQPDESEQYWHLQHLNLTGARLTNVDFSGCFLPAITATGAHFHGESQFHRAQFIGKLWLENVRFDGAVRFTEARFHLAAGFDKAQFRNDAAFEGSQFGDIAQFDGIQVYSDAYFDKAQFGSDAAFEGSRFGGMARFGGAQFGGEARFGGAQFGGIAWFGQSLFGDEARFGGAQFSDDARFGEARFQGAARFNGAQFRKGASFTRVPFEDDVWFHGAQFGDDARFAFAQFTSIARFGGVQFDGSAYFDGAKFGGIAWFEGAHFHGVIKFDLASLATGSTIHLVDAIMFWVSSEGIIHVCPPGWDIEPCGDYWVFIKIDE